jgi:multiple sugar transport system substrate-binding protein
MVELEFSVMARGENLLTELQPLLDQFEIEQRVRVRVTVLTWEQGWTELVKMALYGHGPDVSEVGTTWMGNLIAMDGLRPFAMPELFQLGGEKAFQAANWHSGSLVGDANLYAVPWLADTRLIYYRHSLLEKAGLAAETAFSTPAKLDHTLKQLRDCGLTPWSMDTTTQRVLHDAASWVWGSGGDFVSADGKHVVFAEPDARRGLKSYFELGRYLIPALQSLGGARADAGFLQGQVAARLGDSVTYLLHRQHHSDDAADWGIALPPGPSFVGGSNLVIWKHSRQASSALKLIKWLTAPHAQETFPLRIGLLPVRHEVLRASAFAHEPLYQQAAQGLQHGRSFPAIRLWGLIEDKLVSTFTQIWEELFSSAAPEVESLFDKYLTPLARQIDRTLGG